MSSYTIYVHSQGREQTMQWGACYFTGWQAIDTAHTQWATTELAMSLYCSALTSHTGGCPYTVIAEWHGNSLGLTRTAQVTWYPHIWSTVTWVRRGQEVPKVTGWELSYDQQQSMLVVSNKLFSYSKVTHTHKNHGIHMWQSQAGWLENTFRKCKPCSLPVIKHHTDVLGYRVVLLPYMGISCHTTFTGQMCAPTQWHGS